MTPYRVPASELLKIGARIRELREIASLSQKELADSVGHSQAAISYWESGVRPMDIHALYGLAIALDVAVTDFFPERVRQTYTDPTAELARRIRQTIKNFEMERES